MAPRLEALRAPPKLSAASASTVKGLVDVFDKNDKTNFAFVQYMKTKKCLILEKVQMVRSSVSRTLQSMGALNSNISIFDNAADALEFMRENPCEIVIASDALTGRAGGEFYQFFCERAPSRMNNSFFLISSKSSPSLSLQIAILEIDGLIVRPFTLESLQKIVHEVLTPKIHPSDYEKNLDEAKVLLKKDPAVAQEKLIHAITLSTRPLGAFYYLGVCYRQQKMREKAQHSFRQVLELDRHHYRSLEGLYEMAMEDNNVQLAYEIAGEMVEHYPVDANRLPEFTKLLLANQRFEELINLCKVFEVEEDFSECARLSAAAGLALVGKHLVLHQMKEDGLRILDKALVLARERPRILANIASTLVMSEQFERAQKVLDSLSASEQEDEEVLLLLLEIKNHSEVPSKTLNFAYKLLERKIKTVRVYEIMLKNAFKIGRNIDAMEELVQEASYLHPHRKNFFQTYLKRAK